MKNRMPSWVIRVLHGGFWDCNLGDCRPAYRNGLYSDCRYYYYGFRAVRVPRVTSKEEVVRVTRSLVTLSCFWDKPSPDYCRSAGRYVHYTKLGFHRLGFRVVRVPRGPSKEKGEDEKE